MVLSKTTYLNMHNQKPRLSIIMPIFNEEKTLAAIINRVQKSCGSFSQIIYVDDGSTDTSLFIIRSLARNQDKVITKKNKGKGSAIRAGITCAKGKYTIIQDADLEYSPEEIPKLLEYAEKHNLPALFGSRRLKKQKQFSHFSSFIGGTLLTYLCNFLYKTNLTDQPTCYKMVKTEILKPLPLIENDFRFDPEITVQLAKNNIPIKEYPISYKPRSRSEEKKIWWTDGLRWAWLLVKLKSTPQKNKVRSQPRN